MAEADRAADDRRGAGAGAIAKPGGSVSDAPEERLVRSAAALNVAQATRLLEESEMRIRAPAAIGLGRLVNGVAIAQSRDRVRDRRKAAIAIATEATAGERAGNASGALLEAGRQAIEKAASTWKRSTVDTRDDDRIDRLRGASQVLFEWAALASVGVDAISDDDFATLYGPWWRAVLRGVRPVWVARWSSISLVGCWLTIVGVLMAPFLNQGDAGYATLAIIGAGCVAWGIGALFSTERSRPWPEPARPFEPSTRRSLRTMLRKVWRWPEAVVWRIVRVSQLR